MAEFIITGLILPDVTITIVAVPATAEKTAAQVASDIQTAVQAKVTDSTIPAIEWDGTQSGEARITNAAAIKTAIAAAVTASGKLPTGFTVTNVADETFMITTEPSASDAGSATISITVTKTADSTTGTVTITMTIPKTE